MAINLENSEQFYDLIKSSNLVVIYFWAPWCGPCKKFSVCYEDMAKTSQVVMKKINIDNDALSELVINYGVQSIPTLIVFSNGIEIGREIGVPSDLEKFINSFTK